MSNYTKTTNFATKDSLASGNPNKIVKGTEINSEFDNIATAVATKANTASPSLTGTVTAAALNVTGNLDVDGTLEFDSISGTGSVAVTDIADEDNMSSDSATKLATQQSIKAYVDSQVTAQDLDLTDGSTSISIDLDSEALSVLGGTGVTSTASGNGVTLAIDSTVTTLTGSQTLTNKTLTSPDVNTPDIDGGTIDGTVIGGATAAAGSFTTVGATGNITVGGIVDGRDVATDGTKLDGIEASATADQSNAEIRTAVEAATDSNVFTDADHSKLNAIEASATADQTDAEIRTAVEAASDSNVFTDADHTKLNAIEASADVTDTANVTAAGALMDSELTAIASVKALNQGVATGDSPTFVDVTATSLDISGDIDVDGTTNLDVVDIDGAVDMASTLAVGGVVTANAGVVVDTMTIDGSAIASTGSLGLDIGGNLTIDVDGTTITLADGGANWGQMFNSAQNFYFKNPTADKDIVFQGIDGSTAITMLTLDASLAGAATFGGNLTVQGADVTITGNVIHAGDTNTYFGFHDADQWRVVTGGAERIEVTNTEIVINDSSVDMDFRVESNGNANMLFVDGGNNRVGVGTGSPAYLLDAQDGGNAIIQARTTTNSSGNNAVFRASLAGASAGDAYVQFDIDSVGGYALGIDNSDSDKFKLTYGGPATPSSGTTLLDITSAGAATFTGAVTANAGISVDNITIDSNEIDVSSGDLTLDAAGEIILDADATGVVQFADSGNEFGRIYGSNNNLNIKSTISNEDMLFIGNDGGTPVTALTLDMSAAGAATFNAGVTTGGTLDVGGQNILYDNYDGIGAVFRRNGSHGSVISLGRQGVSDGVTLDYPSDNTFAVSTASTERFRISSDGSLSTPTLGTSNVRFGVNAGNSIASGGNYNVLVGDEAGTNLTTGDANVAVGQAAFEINTTGSSNVAIGTSALNANTTASNNTAVGKSALAANTTGSENTAVGTAALDANTTGTYNTALGTSSLTANTTGNRNVAVGTLALDANTVGDRNVAVGMGALSTFNPSSNADTYNVAVGYDAGTAVTTGIENTLIGGLAGDAITTGDFNTALGKGALSTNTTADYNTAVGMNALQNNTTGAANVALGSIASFKNTTASNNTAIGYGTLYDNTTGANNVAVGYLALENSTTASNNTAVGKNALAANTYGAQNTAVGTSALSSYSGNYNNTAIGYSADSNGTGGNGNITIGYNAQKSAVNSAGQCTLGDANITNLRCNDQSISALSDSRDKTDVIDSPYGLDFINTVRPVQFLWDTRDGNAKDGSTRIGFLAQELLAATDGNNAVLDLVLDDNPDKLEAKYGNLLPIAIQAIQELSAQVEALTARIETLEG